MSNSRRSAIPQPDRVPASAQALMLAGSASHIAYGVGALLAPESMVRAHYAPNTHDLPEPRLLLRAFGGHLLVSGCLVLAATRSPRDARSAAALCLLINAFDVTSALLEWRARGQRDRAVNTGIIIPRLGVRSSARASTKAPQIEPF
jgi:hypothetical protein